MISLYNKEKIKKLLPNHHIKDNIYESGNSIIYKAIQKKDKLPVVLKILKFDHPKIEELYYKQEYEITKRFNSDGIIKAYKLELNQDLIILILEDFDGISLNHWIKKWKCAGTADFTIVQFLQLANKIIDGLFEIHSAGIIHKNINPSNIVFNPETGQLKFIDFAISTALSREIPTTDGEDALDYLFHRGKYLDIKQNPLPHLILLDLRLPKVDGVEVLKTIKSSEELNKIPVVILTTSDTKHDVDCAYKNHANSYLVKPVDFDKFTKLMDDIGFYWLGWNYYPLN